MICKSSKKNFAKKSINVTNVKLLSNIFFNVFGFFMHFWWEWQLAIYKLSDFPGIKHLNGLNDLNSLNNLSGLIDLYSLISSKTFNLRKNVYFWWFVAFYYLKKPPKSQNDSNFINEQEVLSNWSIGGAQHQNIKNWWISHKWLITNEHVGPKILAKIIIYVLTRAELLFKVCYEIPCNNKAVMTILLQAVLHLHSSLTTRFSK